MKRAELPGNMNLAADAMMREAAGQQNTEILNLRELEDMLGTPREVEQTVAAQIPEIAEPVAALSYETMSRAQRLKQLSHLNVLVRTDPDLKRYMDEVFPEGFAASDPALRIYSYKSYVEDKRKSEIDVVDSRVLDAMRYQARQIDGRKLEVSRMNWAENTAANVVAEMEKMTDELNAAAFKRDLEAAHLENDQRKAQARAEVVKQRAVRDIETYLELEDFVSACEAANYIVTDITKQKPEYAVLTLRRLLNEWEKNGVLAPKPEEPEIAEAPIALATLKKAFHAQKQKAASVAPAESFAPAAPPIPVATNDEPTVEIRQEPFVTQSAGARAYAELVDNSLITKVHLDALDGQVVQSFRIERKQQA